MGDVTLNEAIARLSSDKQKDRAEGLGDLRRILQQNKGSSSLDALNDKACHRIFEALFRCVAIEKALFRRTKSGPRSQASSRLPLCASVFRTAVEVSVRRLRTKTVHAVIDHVVQTITEPGDILWDLLGNDYIKSLRTVLDHPAHVEHLSEDQWRSAVTFCLQCLDLLGGDGSSFTMRTSRHSSAEPLESSDGRSTPLRTMPTRSLGPGVQYHKSALEDAVACIRLLTANPNAPVQDVASRLLNGLLVYLSSSSAANASQALKAMNSVLRRVIWDQTSEVRGLIHEALSVMRRLWSSKSVGVKEEILVTMVICMDLLQDTVRTASTPATGDVLEELVDVLQSDYQKRQERELLQVDDLVFYQFDGQERRGPVFGPRLGHPRSEFNWTLLWTISCLLMLLDDLSSPSARDSDADEGPNKRTRLASRVEDVARDAVFSVGIRRASALQLVPFLERRMTIETKAKLLECLTVYKMDDNAFLASWTLLAISAMASSQDAKSPMLRPHWQQIWDLSSRAAASHGTSRAACGLMDSMLRFRLLGQAEVMESVGAMLTAMDINGPAMLCDSSLMLLTRILRLRLHVASKGGLDTSREICNWLRRAWSMASDKSQVAEVALYSQPIFILDLLLSCTSRTVSFREMPWKGPAGPISGVWFSHHQHRDLSEYLFLFDDKPGIQEIWQAKEIALILEASARSDASDAIVVDLLQTRIDAVSQAWDVLTEGKSQLIASHVVQILASVCVVVAAFVECLPSPHGVRVRELQQASSRLWSGLCSYIGTEDDPTIQLCLEMLTPLLRSAPCVHDPANPMSRALKALATPLLDILEKRRSSHSQPAMADADEMDLDEPLSHRNDPSIQTSILNANRESLDLFPDHSTLQRCVTIQLALFLGDMSGNDSGTRGSFLPRWLETLDETDILCARGPLLNSFASSNDLVRSDILAIVELVAEVCLQSYELERCESALCFCIQMMEVFVDFWATEDNDDLNVSASDLFAWFIKLMERKKASSRVLTSLTGLLVKVLCLNPSYSATDDGPSSRTTLFHILLHGDLTVKFAAAKIVPRIFSRFLLKDHEAIFSDVLESLPTDPDWREGIALRLYVLAQLAACWPTLLRRSIYHIFETPGQVPDSALYALKCVQYVTKALELREPKEIFRLFMPQIVYTWTESQSLLSMPYNSFGYSSLKEMLTDAQHELVGQIMMRASDQDAQELSSFLEREFEDLLVESFPKAEAYAIARDISIPPSQDSQPKGTEIQIKERLGKPSFAHCIQTRFPEIVAILFRSMAQEEQIDRAFAKNPNFSFASRVLEQIKEKCVSSEVLPAGQQPSFRARWILDELDYLCRRAGYRLDSMWNPALVTYVCRTLLDSMHPALGSLHACSVLRKIRILVCVSDPVMRSDYPLEQALNALRPFLTDVYCSEDALGLFWFLLDAGRDYLLQNPGFLAGIAVSTFISLRGFLSSGPENGAQESKFRSVLSNVERFRQWLGDFLKSCQPVGLDEHAQESFRRMVRSAQECSSTGNAEKGTYESELLMELLRDRSSKHRLLHPSVSDSILSLLCVNFQFPPALQDDILGEDADASENVVAVWQTVQNGISDPGYRLWASRVLGRAYAATGQIHPELLLEQDSNLVNDFPPVQDADPFLASKLSILRALCEVLYDGNSAHLGLVERSMQLMATLIRSIPELESCEHAIPPSLMKALIWDPYGGIDEHVSSIALGGGGHDWPTWEPHVPVSEWARDLALSLTCLIEDYMFTQPLRKICTIPELATRLLPYILHDVLLADLERDQSCRQKVSEIFGAVLRDVNDDTIPHAQLAINCILYLRRQPRPHENTIVERDEWLAIDYGEAAAAANRCKMHKTALLFIEIQASRTRGTRRRSSTISYTPPPDLLHNVFREIGDPDLFYGLPQEPTLESVMENLDYEGAGFKNLIFQSALYDSGLQVQGTADTHGIIKALNATNLQGVAAAMLSASNGTVTNPEYSLSTAMSLQQWDIPMPMPNPSATGVLFRVLQNLNTASDLEGVLAFNNDSFTDVLGRLMEQHRSAASFRESMLALALLSEVDDVLRSTSPENVERMWERLSSRKMWLQAESFQEISPILHCRETLFSSIKKRDYLRSAIGLTPRLCQLFEVKTLRESFRISRSLDGSQESLKSAISLSKLIEPSAALGLNIDAAAKFDLANVLWDQGEMTTSIRMLRNLNEQGGLEKQAIAVSRAELLATLGHHVAEARLEKPDAIVQDYLVPAVKELRGATEGEEAGRVFHRFAFFCDQQLLNPDDLADFQRIEQLRDRKEKEVQALDKMMAAAEGKERTALKMHRTKAKQWFDLDDREYQRLKRSREAFLQQCLENYLLALKACETYNSDVLRFAALWLDKSEDPKANEAVAKHLREVPSRKFAPLMNQLSSRLLDNSDLFQTLLSSLIHRICVDHPFHGMYQIFATSKTRSSRDPTSVSRFQAANKLVDKLKSDRSTCTMYVSIHNANITYVRFAGERVDEKVKTGSKLPLSSLPTGQRLEQDGRTLKLPPATMRIPLRPDCNYKDVPRIHKFLPEFSVASGISAPKIVTAIATDGSRHKQLFKGGNDDLRQDAIMEQVFEQVSSILQAHRTTRRRNLNIRTYKVLPLTSNAGVIEFVQNTIPLHDYLMPAHQRYYPKDMKPSMCRKHISDVQTRSQEARIRTYRQVTEHFHPVLRFFFMEKFPRPDDWFRTRLAYTRSTAAISMLGHVLGLGDRHGHNILLDEKTGEVVHIDLGVAFEQGRVLPVPEVVPFRLTRDLVDGMGITKTEGVFRRCCEFTLEALRQESYSIMTILDVLRYDPLYSWTLSPLRMKRMQEDQEPVAAGNNPAPPAPPPPPSPPPPSNPAAGGAATTSVSTVVGGGAGAGKRNVNEPSEADRALTVVAKKLSKTLSVTATVNELIQQATDERNLALLYCGWAAYA